MVAVGETLSRLSSEARALLQWWVTEIGEIIRVVHAFIAPRRSQVLALLLKSDQIQVWVQSQTEQSEVVVIEPDASGAWPTDPLKEELDRVRGLRTVLMIPERDALSHVLRFPAASEPNLARIVELALERELPLPMNLLATDWKVLRREERWLDVQVVAIQRLRLETMLSTLREWGLQVNRVAIAPDGVDRPNVRDSIGSLANHRAHRAAQPWTKAQRKWAYAAVVSVVAAFAITFGQWIYERVRLSEPAKEARELQAQLTTVKQLFQIRSEPVQQIIAKERTSDALTILALLSQSVGLDTWGHDISIREESQGGYAIELTGRSPNGRDLVEQLRLQRALKNVTLKSSQMGEVGMGKNRVTVQMRWEGKP
jgi:Type II secretion system (T2SS), protein L